MSFDYVQLGVIVDSPQNQLAPTNSSHIYANSPYPTRPTFIPAWPNQRAPDIHVYQVARH